MIFSHIVAASENNVIGFQGKLPWSLPEDLSFFKEKTLGHTLIMGRKTFESIGKPLKNRLNLVVTRKEKSKENFKEVIFFPSLKTAVHFVKSNERNNENKVFIIGGGEVYEQTLDFIDEIYLTRIHKKIKGDVFYPEINIKKFKKISEKKAKNFNSLPIKYSFIHYKRF